MGNRRIGACRLESVRSVAVEALPGAAAPGEVIGGACRESSAQARLARLSCADGDHLDQLPRPKRLPALRLLRILRMRGWSKVEHAGIGDSRSRKDRALRDTA